MRAPSDLVDELERGAPSVQDLLRAGELHLEFYRSSGPGGQNVNKVETAVRLRFDLPASGLLAEEVKLRLAALAGRRLTADGSLLIEGQRLRTQDGNRQDVLERLQRLLDRAAERPRPRRPTRPSPAAKRKRLVAKKRRAGVKKSRSTTDGVDE